MRNNLTNFRHDNTNGQYSDDELKAMNDELAEELDSLGYEGIESVPEDVLKYCEEKIMAFH